VYKNQLVNETVDLNGQWICPHISGPLVLVR
jgi:hypothetical protein